jgi:hypothetical protein
MNYCGISNPNSDNFVQLVGMLFIHVISGVGNSVAFTSRGVKGLSLIGQEGNVFPLVNDLKKQQKQQKKQKEQQEQQRSRRVMESYVSAGNVTPTESSDEDVTADFENEPRSSNMNTANETRSSYASMNGSGTSPNATLDDSDSDDSSDDEEEYEDEESGTTGHMNRLLNYIIEHGPEMLAKYGVIFVSSLVTNNDPYYTESFFDWFQFQVGLRLNRQYRKLRPDEERILQDEGVNLYSTEYRERVEEARKKEMGQRAMVTAQKRGRFGRKRPAIN